MVLVVMKVVSNVLLLTILIGKLSVLSGEPVASNKCPDRCGEVTIPYPFGIGAECSLSSPFNLTCNETFTPPKPFSGDVEVIDITLSSAQTRVLMYIAYACYNTSGFADGYYRGIDIPENSIFMLSYTDNVYTAVGCDTYALIEEGNNNSNKYTGGCISVCNNYNDVADGPCTGMGCCQAPIPKKLKSYITDFQWGSNHTGILDFNPCSYAFLVQKNNYTFHKSDLKGMNKRRQFPIVLDWYIGSETCEQAKNRQDYVCLSSNSDCFNSSNGPGYICRCSKGYQGNPYRNHGCQDINECEYPKTYPCNGICINTVGGYNCTCPDGASGNPMTYGCTYKPSSSSKELQIAIVVPVVVLSSLLAIALSIWIYALLQRRKLNKLKEKYFSQNGGSILEKRLSLGKSKQETFKIFTREEIEKATNKYDQSRILGRGGQGVVYKGIIPNGNRTFAIKKSLVMDKSNVGEFINEIIILSQINHRNVVKLIGCCLEVEEPLLVYEFVPKGTLFHNIHNESLPWETRVRISSETAGALAYLHTSVSIPIIHRDVKSSNILLDADYTAKVSDFGASKLIPFNKTQVTTLVQGTLGYLDPEYMQTHQLTAKSDVYSFGVVLVELLTGKEPLSYLGNEEERNLANYFISCLKSNMLYQLLDAKVVNARTIGQMKDIANLAKRCLSLRREDRPTMVEVSLELESLRRSGSHPWLHHNNEEGQCLLGEPSMHYPNESSMGNTEEKDEHNTEEEVVPLDTEMGR